MVEISNETMLLVLVVFCFGISTILLRNHYEKKTRSVEVADTATGVKKRAVKGQEDAVDIMKDLTTDSIVFLKDTVKECRDEIKRLKSSVSWYKSQMYGDGRVDDNDSAGKPQPPTKLVKSSDVSQDVIDMRLRMIAEKIKIPQELLMFEDVKSALSEIAGSPNFDQIASIALKSSGIESPSNGKVEGITYV